MLHLFFKIFDPIYRKSQNATVTSEDYKHETWYTVDNDLITSGILKKILDVKHSFVRL